MKFKREKKVMPVIHWHFYPTNKTKSFCGLECSTITSDKNKVNCQRCKKMMKLHGHLPEVS